MYFVIPELPDSIIKVVGVGGGGSNAVNNMQRQGIVGVEFVICNTDVPALNNSPVGRRLVLGPQLTEGLGCGGKPEMGRDAALESVEEIREMLNDGTKMVFITCTMGGGTGTGAAPIIAALAREMGILTIGIVTKPFEFEAKWRMDNALAGIREMEQNVDSLLVINNNNLLHIANRNLKQKEAWMMVDNVLYNAAKGIAEIITVEGYVNVDFRDVETIMKNSGTALMGMARASGEDRALMAVEQALNSPLLENINVVGATGILLNICASEDSLTMNETTQIADYVKNCVGDQARVILGQVFDDSMGDELSVTVIVTGFEKDPVQPQPARAAQPAAYSAPAPPVHTPAPVMQRPQPGYSPQPRIQPQRAHQPEPAGMLFEEPQADHRPAAPQPQTRQDRLTRVRSLDYDYERGDILKRLEDVPAYVRRQVKLENTARRQQLSRTTVDAGADGSPTIRQHNAFLFDQPD